MPQLNYQPVSDFLLIEPIKRGTTDGGLALPDNVDNEPPRGRVVAAGPGRYNEFTDELQPMNCQVGDVVLFGFNMRCETPGITIKGQEYAMVQDRSIILKIPPQDLAPVTLATAADLPD